MRPTALGKGAWVARAATATQGIVVVLAVVDQASYNLIARARACDATDIRVTVGDLAPAKLR